MSCQQNIVWIGKTKIHQQHDESDKRFRNKGGKNKLMNWWKEGKLYSQHSRSRMSQTVVLPRVRNMLGELVLDTSPWEHPSWNCKIEILLLFLAALGRQQHLFSSCRERRKSAIKTRGKSDVSRSTVRTFLTRLCCLITNVFKKCVHTFLEMGLVLRTLNIISAHLTPGSSHSYRFSALYICVFLKEPKVSGNHRHSTPHCDIWDEEHLNTYRGVSLSVLDGVFGV